MISNEIYDLIGHDSFIMVNKKLLRHFKGNADAVVLLTELINVHKMMTERLSTDEFGFFKIPQNWISKVLGMSPGKQKTILNLLSEADLISTEVKGYPATRHISVNFFNIKEIFIKDETSEEDIQREEFYENLNKFLNTSSTIGIIRELKAFGNMKEPLRNVIKYITIFLKDRDADCFIEWNSRLVGITRDFINKKSFGKPFDYAYLKKILLSLPRACYLKDIPEELTVYGKRTVDNSPADQILNFQSNVKELISWI